MNIIPENIFGIVSFTDYWSTRQCYFYSILIARNQIFQETALRIIVSVCFINKVNALHLDIIRIFGKCPTVLREFVDIDNRYL